MNRLRLSSQLSFRGLVLGHKLDLAISLVKLAHNQRLRILIRVASVINLRHAIQHGALEAGLAGEVILRPQLLSRAQLRLRLHSAFELRLSQAEEA